MPIDGNDSMHASGPSDYHEGLALGRLLTSGTWAGYFDQLARALNIEVSLQDPQGTLLFMTNENRFCRYVRTLDPDIVDCPGSCWQMAQSPDPHVFRCRAGIACFSLPIDKFGDRVFVTGRGGFASYDDLKGFLSLIREHRLAGLPVSATLDFTELEALKAVPAYVSLTVNRQLETVEDRHALEEKFFRITSLFDSQAFGTLSKSPDLMYRYVLDTIEFVFGDTPAALLTLDRGQSLYRAVHAVGKEKDQALHLTLSADIALIKRMHDTRSAVFFEDLPTVLPPGHDETLKTAYFFPLFAGEDLPAVIGVFNRDLSREDVKMLNAFREYVQMNLENHNLKTAALSSRKADEKLNVLADISRSIVAILDKEELLNTLLEKSLELLNAEQGSLMILDNNTSELVIEARKGRDDAIREKMRFKRGEGISGMVLDQGGALVVEDIEKDPRFRQLNRPRYRTKSFMSIPIKIEDRLAGVLNLSDKIQGIPFTKHDLKLMEVFIHNVAIAIERSLLYSQTERLQKLSITDPLTGIYNRRYLNRRLSEEITRYNRYRSPFSFIMLDLDKFKEYNDTFGHIAGDNLIRNLASVMEKSLRTIDIAARFGGDEFVAIFPQTPKVDAIQISNRLKEKIESSLAEHNADMPLTISVGLATFPDDASSIMELIEKTDQALYLAKKGGGNRVVYL